MSAGDGRKKVNQHIQVKRPFVVNVYNDKMGGVDMCDRMLSYYRMGSMSRKWTVRTIIHFFDVAAVNSWLQFRDYERMKGEWRKHKLEFLAFKIRLAEDLMAIELEDRMSDDDDGHPRKREPLPGEKIFNLLMLNIFQSSGISKFI